MFDFRMMESSDNIDHWFEGTLFMIKDGTGDRKLSCVGDPSFYREYCR